MRLRRWLLNILLAIDQLGYILLKRVLFYSGPEAGDEDKTISHALGVLKLEHGGVIPWRYPLARIIDGVLEIIDPGHSVDAVEDDELLDRVLRRIEDEDKDGE